MDVILPPSSPAQRLISQLYQMPGMMECLFFKFQVLLRELFSAQEAKCSSTVRVDGASEYLLFRVGG